MADAPDLTGAEIADFMAAAIEEADQAAAMGEVPIGAVLVHDHQIIARAHNRRESDQSAVRHAELMAIEKGNEALHSWRLEDCALFVTLEPCLMCAGAILNARVPAVYFGAKDPKAGAVSSLYHVFQDDRLNHQVQVIAGVRAAEAKSQLQNFFRAIRKRKKEAKAQRQALAPLVDKNQTK
ncbi:tRNA adenosine(34) deaminase TadA [Leuconostocaceae bacterium ESL0958]|nr:tRNA adenosine(34) deaminase TadA [Leuconostocaceae bacterium ESL0958]